MQAFAELYAALDETTRTSEKVAALKNYFASAAPADAIWAVSFLIGRRPKRLLESRKLAQWAIEEAGIPEWLFGECYQAVGDFAETIALLLPPAAGSTDLPLHYWVEERMLPLREADDDTRRDWLVAAWRAMDERQRFAWNKLLTGEFRVGVSQNLVVRALAEVERRLYRDHRPPPDGRVDADGRILGAGLPPPKRATPTSAVPIRSAWPIRSKAASKISASVGEWQVEWKWDGIRAQLIRRQSRTFLWSRGEELITDRFPEIEAIGAHAARGHRDRRRSAAVERRRAARRLRRCSGASGGRCWGTGSSRRCRWC